MERKYTLQYKSEFELLQYGECLKRRKTYNTNLWKGEVFMFKMISCGIIFIMIGAFMFFKPHSIWKLTEQWKSYSADEPSDLYLFSAKFGGVLFAVIGIAAIIVPFIPE